MAGDCGESTADDEVTSVGRGARVGDKETGVRLTKRHRELILETR